MAETISVRFYSGSKGDEKPSCILVDGREKMIVHICGQGVNEHIATGKRTRTFKVRTEDGASYVVRQAGEGWTVSRLASNGKMG